MKKNQKNRTTQLKRSLTLDEKALKNLVVRASVRAGRMNQTISACPVCEEP